MPEAVNGKTPSKPIQMGGFVQKWKSTRHFAWTPDNWENVDEIYSKI